MAKKSKTTGENIFLRFIHSIIGGGDPEADKRRLLKNISKDLSKSKFKFYKYSANEVLAAFGKFFYELYKAVSPAQLMFQGIQNPNALKNQVVDFSLNDTQKALLEELSEESIIELSKSMSFKDLNTKIQKNTQTFMSEFDGDRINQIDDLYSQMMAFKAFCSYDFYFLLKKFSAGVKEHDFNVQPKFDAITAQYIAEDLKDFITVAWALPLDSDWTELFKLLKAYKTVEPIPLPVWKKIVSRLKQVKDSRTIEMIIQLITKDPFYICDVEVLHDHVIDAYLDKMRSQSTNTLKKLQADRKNSQIDSLLQQIFGTTSVSRLKNYTSQMSANLERKNVGSYQYCSPLSYLKAFLVDYVKKDVREYCDLVLIRGQWVTNSLSGEMSNAYHGLLEISDKITELDNSLADDGPVGSKIKTLLPRIGHDHESANIIKTKVKDSNDLARSYMKQAAQELVVVAKNTKALLEDYAKPHGELIINWKELDRSAEHPIKELGVEVYKKIYTFVQLMKTFLQ